MSMFARSAAAAALGWCAAVFRPKATAVAFAPPMPMQEQEFQEYLAQAAFSRQASVLGKQTVEIKVCCDEQLKAWVTRHAAQFGMRSSEYVRNLLWKEAYGYTYDDAVEQFEKHKRELRSQAFAAPASIEGGNGTAPPSFEGREEA